MHPISNICQHGQVDEKRVLSLIGEGKSILDCGCGWGNWTEKVVIDAGFDIHKHYLSFSKRKYVHGVVLADMGFIPFKDKAFDVSLSIELIEHTSKENGFRHLRELERVTKERIILSTPRGFYDNRMSFPEGHVSGWNIEDFEGFKTEVSKRPLGYWLIVWKDL